MSSVPKISLDKNLPFRARAAGVDELSRIFGGACSGSGASCNSTADCCPARSDATVLTCRYNVCRYGT
jgi:hypothetical protein